MPQKSDDMTAYPPIESSPLQTFLNGCTDGKLLYQVAEDGTPVFFPRLFAPKTGGPLEWRESEGAGVVHAATTAYPRGKEPYNVVLVDMDDGFRLMSTVRGFDEVEIPIGLRVQVQMEEIEGEPRPIFVAAN